MTRLLNFSYLQGLEKGEKVGFLPSLSSADAVKSMAIGGR